MLEASTRGPAVFILTIRATRRAIVLLVFSFFPRGSRFVERISKSRMDLRLFFTTVVLQRSGATGMEILRKENSLRATRAC